MEPHRTLLFAYINGTDPCQIPQLKTSLLKKTTVEFDMLYLSVIELILKRMVEVVKNFPCKWEVSTDLEELAVVLIQSKHTLSFFSL